MMSRSLALIALAASPIEAVYKLKWVGYAPLHILPSRLLFGAAVATVLCGACLFVRPLIVPSPTRAQ